MTTTPMIFYPYNFCPNCKTNSLDIYSYHNYAQGYEKIVNRFILDDSRPVLDKYTIYTMRCKNCSKTFPIIWDDNNMPRPVVTNLTPSIFMTRFKQESLKGRPVMIDNVYLEKIPDLMVKKATNPRG